MRACVCGEGVGEAPFCNGATENKRFEFTPFIKVPLEGGIQCMAGVHSCKYMLCGTSTYIGAI